MINNMRVLVCPVISKSYARVLAAKYMTFIRDLNLSLEVLSFS